MVFVKNLKNVLVSLDQIKVAIRGDMKKNRTNFSKQIHNFKNSNH